jgi:hypothetical protein
MPLIVAECAAPPTPDPSPPLASAFALRASADASGREGRRGAVAVRALYFAFFFPAAFLSAFFGFSFFSTSFCATFTCSAAHRIVRA